MSAFGKRFWPEETAGRIRGRMETAVSTPDAWNAQQGEHTSMTTARRAAYSGVRAIGRLYPNPCLGVQSAIGVFCTSRAMKLVGCSGILMLSDNLVDA